MSVGLPGFGLGGLLFVACALLGPVAELVRTLRGTSSIGAWRQTMRQFAIALTMVAVFELTRRAIGAMIGGEIELRSIAVTGCVLGAVLIGAKLLQLAVAMRRRLRERRRARASGRGHRYSPASRLASDPEA